MAENRDRENRRICLENLNISGASFVTPLKDERIPQPMKKLSIAFALVMLTATSAFAQKTSTATATNASAQKMPAAIELKVGQNIAKQYPNNDPVQKMLIGNQRKAYYFLKSYNSALGVPKDVFQKIKQDAAKEYPFDFTMQQVLVEGKVTGYLGTNE